MIVVKGKTKVDFPLRKFSYVEDNIRLVFVLNGFDGP